MNTSTIDRPASPRTIERHRAGSTAFVRRISGEWSPAAGAWKICGGQRLDLATGGLRARSIPARLLSGTLMVDDRLLGSSLDISVQLSETRGQLDLAARVTRLASVSAWAAEGTTTTTIGTRPVSLLLRDHGVFHQRGRQPSLWLSLEGFVDVPELGVLVGGRRAHRLRIAADLNLNPIGFRED